MILIANGCSHTAGAEIEYELQGECYDKAWPKKLADSLNFKHMNLAVSGASDDRVVRTTIECIGRLKKEPWFDPSQLFVIISWPGLFRSEIYEIERNEPGFWDKGWMPMVVGNYETYREQCSKSSLFYYKAWVLRQNHFEANIKFFSNVLLLQNILISNKIKYLFWNSCSSVCLNRQEPYYTEINHQRFPYLTEAQKSYTELLEAKGFKHSPYAKWGHYGEDSQKWFAEFLMNYITKNNLL